MGFDVSSVGAFLGGANQGVGQGMDLYAKYDELKTKNEARQKQRAMEQKVQELAQTGLFKSDPVAATKQLGEYAASIGNFDDYSRYTKTADEISKADQLKSGMNAFTASLVSPQDTAKHLNDWATKGNMPNRFQAVTNADGTFTMLGMGTDPKVGKRYTSMQELHDDTLTLMAPTMLGPEKMMEYEQDKRYKEAQTHAQEASAGHAEAQTEGQGIENQYIGRKAEADIGQSQAAAGASRASAGLMGTQAGDIKATREGRLALQQENLAQERAQTAVEQQTIASRVNASNTAAATAMREEDQAQAIAPDAVGAKRAELRGKAAAAEWEGPKAAASTALTERQTELYGQGKAAAQTKADLDPFIDEATLPGDVVPPHRRAEYVAPLYAYIKAETGAAGIDAAAMASDVAGAVSSAVSGGKGVDLNPARGTITMPNNRVLKIGQKAVRKAKAMADELTASAQAAAAAGTGE